MTSITALSSQRTATSPSPIEFSALLSAGKAGAGNRAVQSGSIRLERDDKNEIGIFVTQPPNSLKDLVAMIKEKTGGRPVRDLDMENVKSSIDVGPMKLTFKNGQALTLNTVVKKLMAEKVLQRGSTVVVRFDTEGMTESGRNEALLPVRKLNKETGVGFLLKPRPGSPSLPSDGVTANAANSAGASHIPPQAAAA